MFKLNFGNFEKLKEDIIPKYSFTKLYFPYALMINVI